VIDGHVLTRCIGGTSELDLPEPFLLRIMWKKGQRLLVCTDGLTDMLDDTEIAAIMDQERRSPAEALTTAALNAGGKDNVTVVVLERLD
jgi:protein phosphatase